MSRRSPPRFAAPGERYGRLLVLQRASAPRAPWLCVCDCGKKKTVAGADLTAGKTRSCGCLHRDSHLGAANANFKHGMTGAPIHSVWKGMLNRCRNPNCEGFSNYGGRGIRVCDAWLEFKAFFRDMGADYSPGLTIERLDVNGDYEPGNCAWVPFERQAVNRRATPFVEWRGTRMAFADAWRASGAAVRIDTAWSRYHRYGWDLERAFGADLVIVRLGRNAPTCSRGHPYAEGNNLVVRTGGSRGCRACDRIRTAAYKLRRAEARV